MKKFSQNNPLPILFFTVFIDLLGFGILIPVIPQLLANPNSPFFLLPQGFTLTGGYILLGFLTSVFPLGQFLATPILGQLSDKYGRKKLLAFSLLGTALAHALFGYGILIRNIPLLFIARLFDGITGGNISVAQASIADVSTPQNRAKNFGLIGAAFGLGFIIGPYLGGRLSDPHVVSWFNAATPFWFAAILSFINVVSLLIFLPETHKARVRTLVIRWGQSVKNIARAFNYKTLRPLFITGFLFQGGFSFYITFFSVFLIHRFGFTQGNIGDYFAYVGLWIALTQAIVTRFIASRFPEYKVLRITITAIGVLILVMFLPTVWWQLLFISPFFALAVGLSQANLVGLVSRSAGPEIQGEVLGINASVQALAQAIPPMLSGFIAASLAPEAPIVVSSIVIIIAGVVFWIIYKPLKQVAI